MPNVFSDCVFFLEKYWYFQLMRRHFHLTFSSSSAEPEKQFFRNSFVSLTPTPDWPVRPVDLWRPSEVFLFYFANLRILSAHIESLGEPS